VETRREHVQRNLGFSSSEGPERGLPGEENLHLEKSIRSPTAWR
jgi:hypothetical protein